MKPAPREGWRTVTAERTGDTWECWTGLMLANLAHALLYDVKSQGAKQQLNALEQTGRDEQTFDFVPEAC